MGTLNQLRELFRTVKAEQKIANSQSTYISTVKAIANQIIFNHKASTRRVAGRSQQFVAETLHSTPAFHSTGVFIFSLLHVFVHNHY